MTEISGKDYHQASAEAAYVALYAYAEGLKKHNIPFGMIIADNEIHAYVVSQEDWNKLEKVLNDNSNIYPAEYRGEGRAKPLVSLTDSLKEQAPVWGWIIVGI